MPCHVEAIEKPVDERALRESAAAVLSIRGMGPAVLAARNPEKAAAWAAQMAHA